MHSAIKASKLRDEELIWIDEAVFKFNAFNTKAWAENIRAFKSMMQMQR